MARITAITHLDDEAVGDYVRLRDVNLRKLLETERGIYIAEGEKVIRRALAAGHVPRSLFVSKRWYEDLADVINGHDVDVFMADESLIESVTGFHVHRGALAAFNRPEPLAVETLMDSCEKIMVLEDITDHANVGSIFRNAAGLGFDGIVLAPRTADPLYRRAIKVSMGAVFALPYSRIAAWSNFPDLLRSHGFTSIALSLDDDALDLATITLRGKIAILLGSEGHGLSTNWSQSADVKAKIAMSRDTDSLNVAAASAIAAWHFRN